MSRSFRNAEQAKAIMYDINNQLARLPYKPEVSKYCYNICDMVDDLSRLEVEVRRAHPRAKCHSDHDKLNGDIETGIKRLDRYILMLRLMA